MKKTGLIIVLAITIWLAGCESSPAVDLTDEVIATFPVIDEANLADTTGGSAAAGSNLAEKFETIGFLPISGQFARNVIEDDVTYTELFSLEKENFIRIAASDMEQEVFAYNYQTDDFTYLYYFDGDLMTKTRFNVATGDVIEDEAGYADLLKTDADDLKVYFTSLLGESGILLTDLTAS